MNNIIKRAIYTYYPKLNKDDVQFLVLNTLKLTNQIKVNKLEEQLQINNYKDASTLISLILPHLENKHMLYNLNDLSIKDNIFSNINYSFKFMKNTIEDNANKIAKFIPTIIDKLYVNWINILPNSIKNPYISKLYFDPSRDIGENRQHIKQKIKNEVKQYAKYNSFIIDDKGFVKYNKLSNGKYLDNLIQGNDEWYMFSSMNWVVQLKFFYNFMNDRIIFLTGATGAGKSSQIPKLVLYGQQMINQTQKIKTKNRVIVTVPRISIVTETASRMSSSLGHSISDGHYSVQFKYSTDKHVKSLDNYIRFTTDGAFLNDITDSTKISTYEVLIVDEVHEHNMNIDTILAMIKKIMKINKNIKLVLMSATMAKDDKRLRQFYDLDTSLDRRVDISFGTQFKITDTYFNKYIHEYKPFFINKKLIKFNKPILENILQMVLDITSRTQGDILLFLSGVKDIKDFIEMVQVKNMFKNIVLIPLYRNNIIQKENFYNKHVNTIKSSVVNILKANDNHDPKFLYKNNTSYTRKLILSTSIAEASITINNLKVVIDTGYVKKPKYDIFNGIKKMILMPISKSSQIQRKGRVGRVDSGYVYYLYSPELISDNVLYPINTNDFSLYILKMLLNDTISLKDIIDETGSFYLYHPDENNIKRNRDGLIITKKLPKIHKYIDILTKLQLLNNNGLTKLIINEYDFEDLLQDGFNASFVLLFSKYYNCFNECLFIFSILKDLRPYQIHKFKFQKYYKEGSDLISFYKIYQIINKITDTFLSLDPFILSHIVFELSNISNYPIKIHPVKYNNKSGLFDKAKRTHLRKKIINKCNYYKNVYFNLSNILETDTDILKFVLKLIKLEAKIINTRLKKYNIITEFDFSTFWYNYIVFHSFFFHKHYNKSISPKLKIPYSLMKSTGYIKKDIIRAFTIGYSRQIVYKPSLKNILNIKQDVIHFTELNTNKFQSNTHLNQINKWFLPYSIKTEFGVSEYSFLTNLNYDIIIEIENFIG